MPLLLDQIAHPDRCNCPSSLTPPCSCKCTFHSSVTRATSVSTTPHLLIDFLKAFSICPNDPSMRVPTLASLPNEVLVTVFCSLDDLDDALYLSQTSMHFFDLCALHEKRIEREIIVGPPLHSARFIHR